MTQWTRAPTGYAVERHSVLLGYGVATFQQATTKLRNWAAHRVSWIQTLPKEPDLRTNTNLIIRASWSSLELLSGCRIAYVLEQPHAFGFAYGTLQQHPARGEERFLVEWLENDVVEFGLYVISKPSNWLYQLGAPLTRAVQYWASQEYLNAMKKAVNP